MKAMKSFMKSVLVSVVVLLVLSATSPAAMEYIFAYSSSGSSVSKFAADLSSSTLLIEDVSFTDIAVGSSGLYGADGVSVHRYSLAGAHQDTSYASTWRRVTVAPDGDAYAYNGSELARMSQHDLKAQTVLVSGAGGAQSIAAGELGVYFADHNAASRYPYTGGWAVDWSFAQAQRVVAVGPDGYVYTRTSNQTIRHDPADLKNHSIIHVWNAASELMDFDGNPIWRNSQIVDIAVGSDAFYAADGTYIWKFELGGGEAIARSHAGGFDRVDVIPEPATILIMGIGGICVAGLRKKRAA